MKVLLATPHKNVTGGISRWAQNIISFYRETASEVDMDILSFDEAKEHKAEYFISKGYFKRVIRGVRVYGRAIKVLLRKIKKDKYDVIHIASSATWGLLRDIVIIQIAHRKGIKCVVHFHFGRIPELSQRRNWEWRLLKHVVKKADKTVVMDKLSYDTLTLNDFNNVEYVPNPLSPTVNDIIKDYKGQTRSNNVVMFAGQCVQEKGIYELIEACNSIPNVELRIYGAITKQVEDELRKKWESKHSTLHIMGNRPFEEIIGAMSMCGVFVLPSYTEGFPNVILESMACGCAIVTTPVGAISEMLEEEDGKSFGIMVEPRNVGQLEDAIKKMLSDTEFREKCQVNAQQRVNKRYSLDSICPKITAIWKDVISTTNTKDTKKHIN